MSKFGAIINQAKSEIFEQPTNQTLDSSPENRTTGLPENQITGLPERVLGGRKADSRLDVVKSVNLSIKVPENLRRHWVSEAKRMGTSITAEVTAALNSKFGKP